VIFSGQRSESNTEKDERRKGKVEERDFEESSFYPAVAVVGL